VLLVCSGRKLTWQTNMGTADIRAQFPSNKRYDLQVSPQAAAAGSPEDARVTCTRQACHRHAHCAPARQRVQVLDLRR